MKVKSVYPIVAPFATDSDISREHFKNLIEYLQPGREMSIRGDTSHDGEKLFVRSRKLTRTEEKYLNLKFIIPVRWTLEFSGSFKFPGAKRFGKRDHSGRLVKMSASELKAIWADILPVELDLSIQSYLFSLTFAFPGSVRPIDNAWWLGGKPAPLPEIL